MLGILVAATVLSALWALRHLGRLPKPQQNAFKRKVAGYALWIAAAFLALKGAMVLAVPLFGIGAGLIGWQFMPFQKPATPQPPEKKIERAEAFAVLGLNTDASSEDIRTAHKKLLRAIHPDTGGSTYLAAKINAARDLLLKS